MFFLLHGQKLTENIEIPRENTRVFHALHIFSYLTSDHNKLKINSYVNTSGKWRNEKLCGTPAEIMTPVMLPQANIIDKFG